MDFDRIVEEAYTFLSLKKLVWFLALFWLAFPVLVFVPWALEKNYFTFAVEPIVTLLFDVMYVTLFVGFIVLLQYCFTHKKISFTMLSVKKILLTVPLVFVEFWHILVWNLHKPFRVPQILLLLGTPLLFYYSIFVPSTLIISAALLFLFCYVLIIVYNFVRLIFTVPLYFSKENTIYSAPKDSWALTHNKFNEVIISLVLILGVISILFFVLFVVFSFVSNILLNFIFIYPISGNLAFRGGVLFALGPAIIAYYLSFTELFNQLLKENNSSSAIKSILAKKVLSKKSVTKKFEFKKSKKKSNKRK